METVEVFSYAWTYTDGRMDAEITKTSSFKVTRQFVEDRKTNTMLNASYQLLEGTRELVAIETVIGGKYHPELRRGFQTQVK